MLFLRPDWPRFLRPDAGRWLKKYDPDQPRVPAGNPDGGQWTSGGGGGSGPRSNDRRIVSDADRDDAAEPGERYA